MIWCPDGRREVEELSVRRYELAAASAGPAGPAYLIKGPYTAERGERTDRTPFKQYFGGGNIGVGGSDSAGAGRVDVYDPHTAAWRRVQLHNQKLCLSGIHTHHSCTAPSVNSFGKQAGLRPARKYQRNRATHFEGL
eukprot:gene12499-biopygen3650